MPKTYTWDCRACEGKNPCRHLTELDEVPILCLDSTKTAAPRWEEAQGSFISRTPVQTCSGCSLLGPVCFIVAENGSMDQCPISGRRCRAPAMAVVP